MPDKQAETGGEEQRPRLFNNLEDDDTKPVVSQDSIDDDGDRSLPDDPSEEEFLDALPELEIDLPTHRASPPPPAPVPESQKPDSASQNLGGADKPSDQPVAVIPAEKPSETLANLVANKPESPVEISQEGIRQAKAPEPSPPDAREDFQSHLASVPDKPIATSSADATARIVTTTPAAPEAVTKPENDASTDLDGTKPTEQMSLDALAQKFVSAPDQQLDGLAQKLVSAPDQQIVATKPPPDSGTQAFVEKLPTSPTPARQVDRSSRSPRADAGTKKPGTEQPAGSTERPNMNPKQEPDTQKPGDLFSFLNALPQSSAQFAPPQMPSEPTQPTGHTVEQAEDALKREPLQQRHDYQQARRHAMEMVGQTHSRSEMLSNLAPTATPSGSNASNGLTQLGNQILQKLDEILQAIQESNRNGGNTPGRYGY